MVFPEDIDNFQEAFTEVVNFIKNNDFIPERNDDEDEREEDE
jgi:hypothetical protein